MGVRTMLPKGGMASTPHLAARLLTIPFHNFPKHSYTYYTEGIGVLRSVLFLVKADDKPGAYTHFALHSDAVAGVVEYAFHQV